MRGDGCGREFAVDALGCVPSARVGGCGGGGSPPGSSGCALSAEPQCHCVVLALPHKLCAERVLRRMAHEGGFEGVQASRFGA